MSPQERNRVFAVIIATVVVVALLWIYLIVLRPHRTERSDLRAGWIAANITKLPELLRQT